MVLNDEEAQRQHGEFCSPTGVAIVKCRPLGVPIRGCISDSRPKTTPNGDTGTLTNLKLTYWGCQKGGMNFLN